MSVEPDWVSAWPHQWSMRGRARRTRGRRVRRLQERWLVWSRRFLASQVSADDHDDVVAPRPTGAG
jgi:hypothetical protein